MQTSQVNAIINCLLGNSKSGTQLKIKSFLPSAPSVHLGTISVTTMEQYVIIFNVIAGKVTSVHSAVTPKGQKWQEGNGNSLILDESRQVGITKLLTFKNHKDKVEVVQIFQVNLNGSKVGRMFDRGTTKSGKSYPPALAVNSFYSEEEANDAARKFREYHEQRESELSKAKKK